MRQGAMVGTAGTAGYGQRAIVLLLRPLLLLVPLRPLDAGSLRSRWPRIWREIAIKC